MLFRMLKMIATSGFLTDLECTKFVFGRGSASDPAGGAYSVPRPPSWFKGDLLLRGGEGRGKEGKGERGGGRRGRGREEEWRRGVSQIPGSPLTGAVKSLQKAASEVVSKHILSWRICTGRILPEN